MRIANRLSLKFQAMCACEARRDVGVLGAACDMLPYSGD
jgi:hypothetical protein